MLILIKDGKMYIVLYLEISSKKESSFALFRLYKQHLEWVLISLAYISQHPERVLALAKEETEQTKKKYCHYLLASYRTSTGGS